MEVIIKDKKIKVDKKDDRFFKTFTPKDKFEIIKIPHMGCFGDTKIKNIQLEKGSSPTFFVHPKSTQHALSGLFKGLRDINIQITDKDSDFWSKLQMNNKAMLREFGDGEMKSAIAQSAKSIISQIESLDKKTESRFQQTDTSFLAQVSNLEERLNSKIQLTKEGVLSQVEDSNKDIKSTLQQKADSILLEVTRKNSATESMLRSEFLAIKSGMILRLSNLQEKFEARLSVTEKGIEQAVTKEKIQAIIKNSGDSITSAIMDKGKDIKSIINQSTDGTYIGGKQLTIDADTYIRSGVIKSAHIEDGAINNAKIGNLTFDWARGKTLDAKQINVVNLDASKITTGTLDAFKIRVKNLTANDIKTGRLSGRNAYWDLDNGMWSNGATYGSNIKIQDGELKTYDGNKLNIKLDGTGLRVYDGSGNIAGTMRMTSFRGSKQPTLGILHDRDYSIGFFYDTGYGGTKPYLIMDKTGKSGYLQDTLYPIEVREGINFREPIRLSASGEIRTSANLGIKGTNNPAVGGECTFIGNRGSMNGIFIGRDGVPYVRKDGIFKKMLTR